MTYTIHRQNEIITIHVKNQEDDYWCAYHEGDEESKHWGYGDTEAEAIAELTRMDDEYAESCEEERSA